MNPPTIATICNTTLAGATLTSPNEAVVDTNTAALIVGVALDCALAGFQDPTMVGFVADSEARTHVLTLRQQGLPFTELAPDFTSWLWSGKPGYTESVHLVDQLAPDVAGLINDGTATAIVVDLTWSGKKYWSLAADLMDLCAMPTTHCD